MLYDDTDAILQASQYADLITFDTEPIDHSFGVSYVLRGGITVIVTDDGEILEVDNDDAA